MRERGWWRRNRWGLVALVPMLVAALVAVAGGEEWDVYRLQPREPVGAAADGWADFAGARVRLGELGPTTPTIRFGGEPVQLAPGVRAWRATVAFAADDTEDLGGCKIFLEDATGRLYEAGYTSELSDARADYESWPSCTPTPSDDPDQPAATEYQTVVHFVLPAQAQAVALRITVYAELPRYLRLVPGESSVAGSGGAADGS